MGFLDELDLKGMSEEERIEAKIEYLNELQEEKDKPFVKLINNSWKKFKSQRELHKEKEWKEAWLMRHGKRIGTFYKGQSRLTSDEVRKACNVIASRIRDILVGESEWFDLKPSSRLLQKIADNYKKYLLFQFDADDIYMKMYSAADSLVTYGKVWGKLTWGINKKKYKKVYWVAVRKEVQPGVYSGVTYKKKTITLNDSLKDNIHLTIIPIQNLYIDATISKIQDQPIIIEEMEVSWGHLKGLSKQKVGSEGIYDIKDSYRKLTTVPLEQRDSVDFEKTIAEKNDVVLDDLEGQVSSRYKLRQAYFLYDINEDGYEEVCMATLLVGDKKSVMIQRPIEIPFLHGQYPYFEGDLEIDDTVAYRQGVPAISREKHIMLCDNTSCMNDNVNFITNRMWLMEKMAVGRAPVYLESEQNKVISVNRFPGLEPLSPNDMTGSHLSIQKFYQEELRDAVGATGSLQGLPSRYGTTAKEAGQMLAQANILITDIIKRLEKTFIEPMVEMASSLVQQFIDEKQFVEIIGDSGFETIEFAPQDIIYPPKFMATGSTQVQNKLMMSQQLLNLLSMAPGLPPETLKIENTLIKWLDLWNVKNPELYVNIKSAESMIKPSDENILMSQGQPVVMNPNEDSVAHLAVHTAGRQTCPEEYLPILEEHIAITHEDFLKKQNQMMMQQGAGGMSPLQQQPSTERGMEMQADKKAGNRLPAGMGG